MNILMVGPHKDKINGGMSTVINEYKNSPNLNDFKIYNLHTVIPGSRIKKILYGLSSIIIMIYTMIFKKIEVVHIHTASGNSFTRKRIFINLASKFNKYILLHIHGGAFEDVYLNSNTKEKSKITQSLDKCNKIIVLSDSWQKKISKMTKSEIIVINNSVRTRNKNPYSLKSKKILFVGRLEEEKGIFDFIELAEKIIEIHSDIRFTICGDGKIEAVKALINEKNINDKFELLGWVSKNEVEIQLKDTMIFILPSYKEAMPMAILEAMSYGIPVVASNVGSIPEVIKDKYNGALFEAGDKKNLVHITNELINNKQLRKKYSEISFEIVNENYSNEVNHNKLKKLYFSINKSRSRK